MTALRDLTGQTFDRLTVVERGPNNSRGAAQWWCLCTCGNRVLVYSWSLLGGKTHSCGCHRSEVSTQKNTTHGMAHLPEYATWTRMIDRCLNPNNPKYPDYGGRGITICERWRESFEAFYADMGPRPSSQHSLDRFPDPNGPYAPENGRWATLPEQARNKRNNHWVTFNGTTLCLSDWAQHTQIHVTTLRKRLSQGWSVERTLTTPPRAYP